MTGLKLPWNHKVSLLCEWNHTAIGKHINVRHWLLEVSSYGDLCYVPSALPKELSEHLSRTFLNISSSAGLKDPKSLSTGKISWCIWVERLQEEEKCYLGSLSTLYSFSRIFLFKPIDLNFYTVLRIHENWRDNTEFPASLLEHVVIVNLFVIYSHWWRALIGKNEIGFHWWRTLLMKTWLTWVGSLLKLYVY